MKNWFVFVLMAPLITFATDTNDTDYRLYIDEIGSHLEYIVPHEAIENIINKISYLKQHRENYMNDIEVTLFNINYGRVTSAKLSSQYIDTLVTGLKRVGQRN